MFYNDNEKDEDEEDDDIKPEKLRENFSSNPDKVNDEKNNEQK